MTWFFKLTLKTVAIKLLIMLTIACYILRMFNRQIDAKKVLNTTICKKQNGKQLTGLV